MLDELVGYIARNPHHHDIRPIDRRPITRRRFDRWHMGLLVTDAMADTVARVKAGAETVDTLVDAMHADAVLM